MVLHRPFEPARVTGKVEASTALGDKPVQEYVPSYDAIQALFEFFEGFRWGCWMTVGDEGGRTPYYRRPVVRCGQIRFRGELLGIVTQRGRLGHW
jgi:hypothetical protein